MQFRLGSIPVRVRAPFFFMVLLLGAGTRDEGRDGRAILIWGAIVFGSVLLHELGHALVGRAFGLSPQIELHAMGGTTSWTSGRDVGNARSIAISLAGPFAGFALGVPLLVATHMGVLAPHTELARGALTQLLWVNIGWGIVNLVPMLPLDGGNVMRSLLQIVTKGKGEKAACIVSIVFAGAMLLFGLALRWIWFAMLGGLYMASNIQGLRAVSNNRVANASLAAAIQQAYRALDAHDGAAAISVLGPAIVPGVSQELRQVALRLFAYALLLEGQWGALLPMLETERMIIGVGELERYATTARELGRSEEAARIDSVIASMRPRMANDFS
ncbi:MAG: site-2 protease family protein [Polyangiaceae bacterium]|nr:site-2 protease family protein [Polyangiaceae bacterium]